MIRRIKTKFRKKIQYLKNMMDSEIIQEIRERNNLTDAEIDKIQKKIDLCYHRIEIVEQNLNYYNMIKNIEKQFDYVSPELLLFQKVAGIHVLLVGFYGAYNLGDELMLQSLFECLKGRKDIHLTVMLCDNLMYDYTSFPNVNIIHFPKNMADYNVLAQQYDCLIWGGGALIDDTQYDMRYVNDLGNMLVNLSKRFIAFDKKCVMLGLSSNQFILNKEYIKGLKFIAENSSYFSVRDEYTRNVLLGLGMQKKYINILNDLVFAHPIWRQKPIVRKKNEKIVIGIVLLALDKQHDKICGIVKSIYDSCVALYGTQFVIHCIPFYNYNNRDFDFMTSLTCGLDNLVVCDYHNDINDVIEEMCKVEVMISMRYHATLISKVIGIPSLSICVEEHPHYHNKMKAITEMSGAVSHLISYEKIDKVDFGAILQQLSNVNCKALSKDILYATQEELNGIMDGIFGGK